MDPSGDFVHHGLRPLRQQDTGFINALEPKVLTNLLTNGQTASKDLQAIKYSSVIKYFKGNKIFSGDEIFAGDEKYLQVIKEESSESIIWNIHLCHPLALICRDNELLDM